LSELEVFYLLPEDSASELDISSKISTKLEEMGQNLKLNRKRLTKSAN
jgi:hypothetical protein